MRATRRGMVGMAAASVLVAGSIGFVGFEVNAALAAPAAAADPADDDTAPRERETFGASCDTTVEGSRVTAACRNPFPRTDRVRLHVECARWWDVDTDSAPVAVAPTAYVELTQRCWKEVRAAWITHLPERDSSGT